MDWRLKCLAFHTIARIPGVHRFLQKHITHRYYLTVTDEIRQAYDFHLQHFRGGTALEIGAGQNLAGALLLSRVGKVIAYDIAPLAEVSCVNHVIAQIGGPKLKTLTDLEALYGIRYVVGGLENLSPVDFICSTSVLEHVPERELPRLLAQCRRLLKPGGVMTHRVDYHDHYTGGFDFYRYPAWAWRIFNPSTHFQNRLRHQDYVRLLDGFSTRELWNKGPEFSSNGEFVLHVPLPVTIT